ncbi:hypothetical protein PLESTF_000864600 [Pleodorina starrii]|nr:hypothetical protein PLESTF_000864600 [Pleodorina starrii]
MWPVLCVLRFIPRGPSAPHLWGVVLFADLPPPPYVDIPTPAPQQTHIHIYTHTPHPGGTSGGLLTQTHAASPSPPPSSCSGAAVPYLSGTCGAVPVGHLRCRICTIATAQR